MPFGSAAAHDPAGSLILWARWEFPDKTMNKMIGMNIQEQTVVLPYSNGLKTISERRAMGYGYTEQGL
ncbi:MAG TPA: hypothetical protein VNL13_08625 [Sulfolobales archaeon]|nr:hypothetical protein [Sulfolobales archaeon]